MERRTNNGDIETTEKPPNEEGDGLSSGRNCDIIFEMPKRASNLNHNSVDIDGVHQIGLTFPVEHEPNKDDDDEEERNNYPRDSYSFISIHGPKNISFWFGLMVFAFQLAFLLLAIISVSHPVWSANGDVDNPGAGIIASFVASNTSPLVHATQIVALLSYILFADASMMDVAFSIELFPRFRKRATANDRAKCMAFSCFLRFVQGMLAMFTALILIITSNTVIDIVLNFTALNFISAIDNAAFELALWGRYGPALEAEAKRVQKERLPERILPKNRHLRFWVSMAMCAFILLGSIGAIIYTQLNDNVWVTNSLRVEFQWGTDLQAFSGCYEVDKSANELTQTSKKYRRKVYKRAGTDTNGTSRIGYCVEERKWMILSDGDMDDICAAGDKELAYSAKTEDFDVSTTFDQAWFSVSGTPLDLYFTEVNEDQECELLNDGVCHGSFNTFQYQYDGGDCCSATCRNAKCASLNTITVFGENTTGIHFPDCSDPTMKDLTIVLSVSSSFDQDNIDLVYPDRNKDRDYLYDFSREPDPTTLKLECDGKFVLVMKVDKQLTNKSETVTVRDGARCSIEVERTAKGEDEVNEEYPFWIVDFTVFEGEDVTDNKLKIVESNNLNRGKTSFLRIPECFSEKLSEVDGMSNLYGNELIMDAIEWMVKDWTANSNCQDTGFLERLTLSLVNFATRPNATNWIGTAPTCLWSPVECSDNGFVSGLDLSNRALQGTIPSNLGYLTSLRRLDLSGNELEGTIPIEIGQLSLMERLNFNGNLLVGSIPVEIVKLKNIHSFSVGGNLLSGSIPVEIVRLTDLKELNLRSNLLVGSISTEIGMLTNVMKLNFRDNDFDGSIPTEIGMLANVKELNLRYNAFDGAIPTEIGQLTKVRDLDLTGNRLDGSIPREIGELTNVKELHLDYNDLSGSIPTEIGFLTNATGLFFANNIDLTGVLPEEISSLTLLECLSISGTNISISEALRVAIQSLPNYQSETLKCALSNASAETSASSSSSGGMS